VGHLRGSLLPMDGMTADEQVAEWAGRYARRDVCVAELLCDRHARPPERLALFHEDQSGHETRLTFGELRDLSARFAAVLRELGVRRGDRVATLLPKSAELVVTTVAIWRLGAVHVPLFTAFGPDAIALRLSDSGSLAVVTDTANRAKLDALCGVRIVTAGYGRDGDELFWPRLEAAEPMHDAAHLGGDDLLVLIYTSGTTGQPKGVQWPVRTLAWIEAYMRLGLDVREDDVFWMLADPGWAYGLAFGLIGTLLLGRAPLYHSAPFDPDMAYRFMRRHRVTNLAAAPTVYRAMRAAAPTEGLRMRAVSSAGEPLNPELISWTEEHLGAPAHDHYGQSEVGVFILNPHASGLAHRLRAGSMGHALPGFRAVVLDEAGNELGPGAQGQIAIDVPASSLYTFRGYWGDHGVMGARLTGDGRYYVTGDTASVDADGYFFYSSRGDDIIKSAGYRIGPFEVESALVAHPAVAEAAAVGTPDQLRGAVVKAFVVLRPGHSPSEELTRELQLTVRARLAAHAYPREIEFVEALPKTPSGKVQRFILRGQIPAGSA
jgi:acetyl-CoA synthetase